MRILIPLPPSSSAQIPPLNLSGPVSVTPLSLSQSVQPEDCSLIGQSEGRGSSLLSPLDPVPERWDGPSGLVDRTGQVSPGGHHRRTSPLAREAAVEDGAPSAAGSPRPARGTTNPVTPGAVLGCAFGWLDHSHERASGQEAICSLE